MAYVRTRTEVWVSSHWPAMMVAPSCGERIPVGVVGGRHGNAARFWTAGTVDAPARGRAHASTAVRAAKETEGLNETIAVGL